MGLRVDPCQGLQGLILALGADPAAGDDETVALFRRVSEGPGDGIGVVVQGGAPGHVVASGLQHAHQEGGIGILDLAGKDLLACCADYGAFSNPFADLLGHLPRSIEHLLSCLFIQADQSKDPVGMDIGLIENLDARNPLKGIQ